MKGRRANNIIYDEYDTWKNISTSNLCNEIVLGRPMYNKKPSSITLTHIPHWRETKFSVVPGVFSFDDLKQLFAGRPEIKCKIDRKRGYADITYTNVTAIDHNMIVSYLTLTVDIKIKSKVAG